MLGGVRFQMGRAIAAKATLDEIRLTPGSHTGQDKLAGHLLLASSAVSSLDFMARPPMQASSFFSGPTARTSKGPSERCNS